MSRSHHITRKDLKGFSKKEIDEMENDPDSLLHQLADKRKTKKDAKEERINKKNAPQQQI